MAISRFLIAASVIAMMVVDARADCAKLPDCDAPGPWIQFTSVTLDLTPQGSPSSMAFKALFDHDANDFLIDLDVRDPSAGMKGTVGMVAGRVMLSRGVTLRRGAEIDAIDGPILYTKLLSIVLDRALPEGPSSVSGTKHVDYAGKKGIPFATPSAQGYIPMPWSAKGKVRKLQKGAFAFDIALAWQEKSVSQVYRFKGEYSMRTKPVFDEGMSLNGWTLYGVGVQVDEHQGTTTYDYGAKPTTGPDLRTVADVRAHIHADVAEQNNPGTRDATKDFTGFWKEKCEQNFGVSIQHRGDEGKYAAVFCGPGGCGDSADARLTFITGDRHYEVVSEEEIYEVYPGQEKGHMVRCTKDPHPALK
jgi:hypothetical protein